MEPALRAHIDSLLSRFRTRNDSEQIPILQSSTSIASPPETTDIQTFLVLCPADVITVYNALYPFNSLPNTFTKSQDINRFGTRANTRPLLAKSMTSGDYEPAPASMPGSSGSSATSDSASSYVPLLNRPGESEHKIILDSRTPFPASCSSPLSASQSSHQEKAFAEKLASELRSAIESLKSRYAIETLAHPCAEKWAVLFVSEDGQKLSSRTQNDWDEDENEEQEHEYSHAGSDSEDEEYAETSGLGSTYSQLNKSVKRLVTEYEIPESLEVGHKFSNKPSTTHFCQEKINGSNNKSIDEPPLTKLDPSNPFYSGSNLTALITANQNNITAEEQEPDGKLGQSMSSALTKMLQAAYQQGIAQGDYVSAHQYHRALSQLGKMPETLRRDGHAPLLHIFSRGSRVAIDKYALANENLDAWFVWLTQAHERQECAVKETVSKIRNLRDKMWYVTDVRNSAAYEEAKSVTVALKKMAQLVKSPPGKQATAKMGRGTISHRISTSNMSLLKSDTLLDILAAPVEHGGPNKLSDEQADITATYLSRFSVENFCKGEERIHRFCFEIDKCVNKLVGESILDGPVLWSSELFSRDDRDLASDSRKGELYLPGLGMVDLNGECCSKNSEVMNTTKAFEISQKPSASDMLGVGRSRYSSSASENSSGRGRSRSNAGLESMLDQQDIFSSPSPILPQPSATTFWSPFASLGVSTRSKISQPPQPMVAKIPTELNEQKRKFLAQLKQNLTGLLLSDLGSELFSNGSETDAWFSSGLADDCIQRKEAQEGEVRKRSERQPGSNSSIKKTARKKSTKSLRRTATHNNGLLESLGKKEEGELVVPSATRQSIPHEQPSGEDASISNDAHTNLNKPGSTSLGSLASFPYRLAFKDLLHRFSIHPNPYQKLMALYDLELLVVASLSSTTLRISNRKISTTPLFETLSDNASRVSNLNLSQPHSLEGVIANVEERRSNVMSRTAINSPSITPTRSRSPSSITPSTDQIVEVLQSLLRDTELRPSTLFRDLQYVAAFVPASILDMTEIGKAFWDTGLAALGLKQDVCRTMVEIADEIISYHTRKRVGGAEASVGSSGSPLSKSHHSGYTMKDAARMWTITAKEGDPTAQRELAIFYLTNPSLLARCVKPLSKPKDTFRPSMMVARGEDPEKRDPATMCVSYHWMELSSQGGDELAKKYLRQRDEGW